MFSNSNTPDIKVDIVSPPSVKDMTVSQVGQSIFSVNLNIMAVIRFVSKGGNNITSPVTVSSSSTSVNNTDEQLKYSDGATPQPGGESAAFHDFVTQHGYPPQSREILAEWVKLQQGGG